MEISRATYHMEYILYIEIIRMLTSYLELMCFVRVCVDALKPYSRLYFMVMRRICKTIGLMEIAFICVIKST